MRSYFWKFALCLVPCLLAAWVTTDAIVKYRNGDSGGFKLGVDLVGGTILVYEIDLRKTGGEGENKFDAAKDVNTLAESLKRRIDPNDLYNIIIRPAGGEGRVEIILPTGGTHRMQKAEENWRGLVQELETKHKVTKLDVGRGKILDLADRIQQSQATEIWAKKLFADKTAWARVEERAVDYWATLDTPAIRKQLQAVPPGDLKQFSDLIVNLLAKTDEATTDKTVQTWFKKQAWEEMMVKARAQWSFLAPYKDDMERITPDSVEQLVNFIQAKGSIVGQAGLNVLEPLVGTKVIGDPSRDDVAGFIKETYGPSLAGIQQEINTYLQKTGHGRDLSVEEVQRIKDLVAKVGKLEFRILANDGDDSEAIKDAVRLLNEGPQADPKLAKELKDDREKGLPPPGPRVPGTTEPQRYNVNLARNQKSILTYSWAELGPQERKQLNLDNAARNDPARNAAWVAASLNRDKATTLPEPGGAGDRKLLQGALFYSRKCEDRNLPEEERRQKEIEYFILTRDPEFDARDETKRTPAISGDYLVNAYGGQGGDMRPAVHFKFSTDGGNLFGDLTRKNVTEGSGPEGTQKRRHLAIILDGLVMSAPTINTEIRSEGQITGSFTQKEVDGLVNILRAGRLPATLKPQPVSESTIAATLGEDTISRGVQAVFIAFAAVLAFMCVYYRFAGIVASLALLANLLLTVGFMVAVSATFTLPGLAGLVLMLGMAVDANVLIYERLREERERGASLAQAIRNGYDHALPTIIDTHLSSIFTAIVLYVVGNDQLKGFAVSLTAGLIISLFTSLFMTRTLFDYGLSRRLITKLSMLRLFARPNIDFMGIRRLMFGITLVVSLLGFALFIGRLPNDLNIDFTGGTAYGGKLTQPLSVVELRDMVDEANQKKALAGVKVKEVDGPTGRRFELTYPNGETRTVSLVNPPAGTSEERTKILTRRASELPDAGVELLYSSTESPETIASGKSHDFNVRSSEKEPELVQSALDVLLRNAQTKEGLLKRVYILAEPIRSRETRLYFYDEAPPSGATPTSMEEAMTKAGKLATGSPSFIKSLLSREMRQSFGLNDEKVQLPVFIEVTGEGKSDVSGKYHVLKVTFTGDLNSGQLAKVEEALKATEREFRDRPQPDRLENFDSALATETRFRALWAVLASWAAIMLYLWFRFGSWTFGLAAVLCLIHDLFFTLGAIAAAHFIHGTFLGNLLGVDDFKIDLPAVAALLTLVGYSVNDTIVVFDRIREVRGKNPDLTSRMINDSINQTLSRTVLASLTTWLVVFVLYIWGGPGVHLFAFVMVVGVIVGTYSSIYIASPLLLMFREGKHDDALPGGETRIQPQGASV